jgi:thioredoxin 1
MPEPAFKEPLHVTDANFDAIVAQSHQRPVLLEFWLEGCGHCRLMAPSFRVLAGEYEGRMDVATYRIDAISRPVKRFQVRGTPTTVLLHQGKEVWRAVGFVPLGRMRAELDRALASIQAPAQPQLG